MADIPNRDDLEKEFARRLGKMLKTQMGRLLELLGDPPSFDNVPQSFWDETGAEFADVVRPFLQKIFLEQAGRMMEDEGLSVDWALVNKAAIEWAGKYTFDLIKGINDTSRAVVRAALRDYFEGGQTIQQLEDALAGTFGVARASQISVTEITRAATNGERAIVDELAKAGITMKPIFGTNKDDRVCGLCGPMDGKEIKRDEDYPPLHVGCRCMTNHQLVTA